MSVFDRLKQQLVCVFDDNLHTKVWHNVADWTIIALIVISSLEVFLSTFAGVTDRVGGLLRFIDIFTTIVFAVEVSLRIWVADAIDPKYAGFKGRLRYCFSFYGLIDILSTYPALLALFLPIPVGAMKIFRIVRLLRVFRYMKAFRILGEAISSKKQELTISFAFLGILTVILSFLLYYAEHDVQPELCENGWKTLVWAFAKYLGDPGKIADFPLITFWGHFIAAIVGALGIAIFAVPAGLIGSGFVEVIESRKKQEEIETNRERIRHSFRWEKDQQHTNLFYLPPYRPIDNILIKQYISDNDVVQAVKDSVSLHLYNLAKAYSLEDAPLDRVVVVCCPHNRPYGYCVDRGSKVTIVSTTGDNEPLTSWVAYHIAKIGGFNYVAKEIEQNPDNPTSFYNIPADSDNSDLRQFIDDIDRLACREGSWVIPMCFCCGPKTREHKVHLCYSPVKHDHGYDSMGCTVADVALFDSFASDLSSILEKKYGLQTDRNDYYVIQQKVNLLHHIKCGNGFALRLECASFYFPDDKLEKIKDIADCINRHFEPEMQKTLPPEMLNRPEDCFGYNGYQDFNF